MKKGLKPFLLYVILMLADGLLTLYNTPDLSMEGNPLVTHLNLGWGALITVNLIFFAIMFLVCRYAFDTYQTIVADVPDLKSYISQLFYNRPDKFHWFWYKFPKNWKPFGAWFGYTFVYGLSGGAVVRVFEWLAITFDVNAFYASRYDQISDEIFFGRVDIFVGLMLYIILTPVWFRKEYKKSCLIISQNQTAKQ